MATFVVYLLLVAGIIYFISTRRGLGGMGPSGISKTKEIHPKPGSQEVWKQVYETASMDEARLIRTRLGEEGIECILYEQGKKDIHGNLLKGVGVAVPGSAVSQAQASIAKIPA